MLPVLLFAAAAQAPPLFAEAPFDFGRHQSGATGRLHLVEMMGAGAGFFDADGDGDLDVVVAAGGGLETAPPGAGLRIYRNLLAESGQLGFREATEKSGLAGAGYGFGLAAGDIDEDGDLDLFLANFGADRLWRNLGDFRFEEITAPSGVSDGRWSAAASFFDYDGDGRLDLFVANYLDFETVKAPPCFAASSRRDYCGPAAFDGVPNALYRNLGGGRFADASRSSGIAGLAYSSLGAVALDFDRDGRCDLFVANDGEPNELWRNEGGGRFAEMGLLAGAALNADGQPEAGMGVAAADFDEDGDEDLFLTHLVREKNTLYLNLGDGGFADRSAAFGLLAPSLPFTSFGTAFLDLDRDGWLDLVTVSGGVKLIEELLAQGDPVALGQRKQLFRSRDGKRFEEWSERGGEAFARLEVSRGLATGDVDNDGDTDLLVGNNGGTFRLLLAQPAKAPWLGLRLLAGKRDAYQARAVLRRRGAPSLHRTVRADGSFGATSDPRLLFGLAAGSELESLLIFWPDGRQEVFPPPPLDTYTTLRQGSGKKP